MNVNRTIVKNSFDGYKGAPCDDQYDEAELALSEIWLDDTELSAEAAVEALAMALNSDDNWKDVYWKKVCNQYTRDEDLELAYKIYKLCYSAER